MTEPLETVARLADAFTGRFGVPPARVARAPGRVNLIGDHTDYCGLPVFPMAIPHEITMLVRPREDGEVRLANVDAAFEPFAFELGPEVPASAAGHWANYAKAAGQALVRACGPLTGFDGLVRGTIPQAAGLSSSSALVVAAALALVDANAIAIEPRALMALMADAEHYVGTRGGAMDQAICLGARRGAATRIGFRPLALTPVPVPAGWRFVVGFSGVRAHKSAEARAIYNQRTEECREAFPLVAERAGLEDAGAGWAGLLTLASTDALTAIAGEELEEPLDRRVRHVVTEAARVEAAVSAMRADDPARFGALMSASHRSLRDDYEVSCTELDTLVDLAMAAGARGARLTGAGFGGCVVALAGPDTSAAVLEAWTRSFHAPRGLADAAFVAEPAEGATVRSL